MRNRRCCTFLSSFETRVDNLCQGRGKLLDFKRNQSLAERDFDGRVFGFIDEFVANGLWGESGASMAKFLVDVVSKCFREVIIKVVRQLGNTVQPVTGHSNR